MGDKNHQGLQARVWATPKSSPSGPDNARKNRDGSGGDDLVTQVQGQLNPDWVEWLMNWPIKWSSLDELSRQEFKRWAQTSAADVSEPCGVLQVWINRQLATTPHRPRHEQQRIEEYSDALHQVSRFDPRTRALGRPHEDQNLPLLRSEIRVQAGKREDLQPKLRKQSCLDEAPYTPRTARGIVNRVARLKAIGNGQVPLVAATALTILMNQLEATSKGLAATNSEES